MVLVDKSTRRILAVGAKAALGDEGEAREGEGILVRPFKNGLLYSSELTREIIDNVVSAIKPAEKIRCIIGLPSDMLPKQETEIFAMLEAAGVAAVCVHGRTRAEMYSGKADWKLIKNYIQI